MKWFNLNTNTVEPICFAYLANTQTILHVWSWPFIAWLVALLPSHCWLHQGRLQTKSLPQCSGRLWRKSDSWCFHDPAVTCHAKVCINSRQTWSWKWTALLLFSSFSDTTDGQTERWTANTTISGYGWRLTAGRYIWTLCTSINKQIHAEV